MGAFFDELWSSILNFIKGYHLITDTLDILLVAFTIFSLIKLVRDSRAEQLIKGFFLLGAAYVAAHVIGLTTLKYLLQVLFDNALILVAVIFQPEIRRALEQVGHSGFSHFKIMGLNEANATDYINQWKTAIAATGSAVGQLQREKMGALIVFERHTRLGEIAKTGTTIDAQPTGELIANIFFNKAPLHDGATIIRDGKILAASCILPLTDNITISRSLGTRHRAGVGMSENSDAVVVIVSEETGTISVAKGGELQRDFTIDSLCQELENEIIWKNVRTEEEEDTNRFTAWLRKGGSK